MFTPSGSLAEISHDGTPEAISAIARATTGRDGVRAKLTDHLERFLCFVKAFRRNDKRQQEEGQEAAGGRTRSSRRKDRKQEEEGQEAAGGRTRCSNRMSLKECHEPPEARPMHPFRRGLPQDMRMAAAVSLAARDCA